MPEQRPRSCRWPTALACTALVASALTPLAAEAPKVPAVRHFRVADRTPVLIDLLAFASDRDGDALTCAETLTSAAGVALTRVADCVFEYAWPADPLAQYDEVVYRILDSTNELSNEGRLTLTSGNFAPLAPASPTGLSATAQSSTLIQLSWYDQSSNESSFRVQGRFGTGAFSVLAESLPPNSQSFTLVTTAGASWEFFVEACNAVGCSPSTTSAATTPAGSGNQLPVAQPDSGSDLTVVIGGFLTFPKSRLLTNDSDPDPLEVLHVVAPLGVSATPKGEIRELTGGPNGWYVYHHTGTSAGSDTFSYTISDGEAEATSSVTISITSTPSPTVALPNTFSTAEGVPLFIRFADLLSNDSGSALNLQLLSVSAPTQGRLDFCCSERSPGPPQGFWFLPEDNNLNAATFQYTVSGTNGTASAAVTVNINPDGTNPDATETFANKTVTHILVDANGDLTPGATSQTVLTFSDLKRGFQLSDPILTLADRGDLLQFRLFEIQEAGVGDVTAWITPYVPYTPGVTAAQWSPKDYEGAFVVSRTIPPATTCSAYCQSNPLSYRLRGADGLASPWTAMNLRFEKPSATGIPFAAVPDFGPALRVPEGERLDIPVTLLLANDVFDATVTPNPFNSKLLGRPVRGTFEGNPIAAWALLRYRAPSNYRGVDHFAYSITPESCANAANEWACSSMARAVIEILPGAPVAVPDAVAVPFETAVRFAPLGNDGDPQGQPVRVVAINIQPQHGTALLEPSGTIVYTPARGYSGPDTLRYRIEDPWGNLATADVTLTVGPRPNRPPVAVEDGVTVETGSGPVSIDLPVLANDFDPDAGDALQVIDVAWTMRAVNITILPGGILRYEAPQPFADTFTYTISDGHGGTASAKVYLTLVPCPTCI